MVVSVCFADLLSHPSLSQSPCAQRVMLSVVANAVKFTAWHGQQTPAVTSCVVVFAGGE